MRRSELIARLNSLRHEIETTGIKSNSSNLETIETCLYYFIDEEDADPHAYLKNTSRPRGRGDLKQGDLNQDANL